MRPDFGFRSNVACVTRRAAADAPPVEVGWAAHHRVPEGPGPVADVMLAVSLPRLLARSDGEDARVKPWLGLGFAWVRVCWRLEARSNSGKRRARGRLLDPARPGDNVNLLRLPG